MNQNVPMVPGGQSAITAVAASKFPNPFFDMASEYIPSDLVQHFQMAEFIMSTMGVYRAATRRVARYFLTEVVIEGASDDQTKEHYEDLFKNKMHILQRMAEFGDDYLTYGNSFLSIYFPFERFLICPECTFSFHSDTSVQYKFDPKDVSYSGECPKCKEKVKYLYQDRRSADLERVRVIRWNPKDIRIRYHMISGQCEYWLKFDPKFVNALKTGDRFFVNQTPKEILEAALKSESVADPYCFKFERDQLLHFKDASLAGIPVHGWAIPPVMANFRLAYYLLLLRRYDEAIALDYILPFRVIYPQATGVDRDPLELHDMGDFVSVMENMISKKRLNLTDIQISPYPIGYEALGGEGKNLSPKDLQSFVVDEMLNSVGYPAELFKGTLQLNVAPVALRMFEKSWGVLLDGYNAFLQWTADKVAQRFLWDKVKAKLQSVTIIDDIENKALRLQAAAGQDISKGTAYSPIGIDYQDEQRRIIEEQTEIQRLQQEAMDEQQAQQMGAAPMTGPNGEQMGATPGDVYEQGKALAQQLLFQTPETMRRGELIKIKHSNPTLHAIVTQEMDNLRQDMARQGQAQMMMQMQAQGQGQKAASHVDLLPVVTLLFDQLSSYTRNDLRKIAHDIKKGVKGADSAFHYIFTQLRGYTTK